MALQFYVTYIIECRNQAYYVGAARYLHYRIQEHSGARPSNRKSKYVSKKGFKRLVYFEFLPNKDAAYRREGEIKHWHDDPIMIRAYKEYLVSNFPQWKLEEYDRTQTNQELRSRILLNIGNGRDNFQPLKPIAWVSQYKPLSLTERHKRFVNSSGKTYRGIRKATKGKRYRSTHCYLCAGHLDSDTDVECVECGWLLCRCGACGCGFCE